MTCEEEQEMELEALKSIFMDEFKENPKDKTSFEILIKTENEKGENLSCVLSVKFPSGYPQNEQPILDIHSFENVYESKKVEILSQLDTLANENLGSASVYIVVERLKELLPEYQFKFTAFIASSQSRKGKVKVEEEADEDDEGFIEDEEYERRRRKEEAEEQAREEEEIINIEKKRKAGTPFTMENFNKWKAGFDAELEEKRQKEQSANLAALGGKNTGRFLFESGVFKPDGSAAD